MLNTILPSLAMLLSAMLFGGIILFSFTFAFFMLKHLPADVARPLIRKAFPPYYLLVIVVAALAGVAALPSNLLSAGLMFAVSASTIVARQMLMPAINAATDRGDKPAFGRLHGLSVLIQLVQIAIVAVVLLRF